MDKHARTQDLKRGGYKSEKMIDKLFDHINQKMHKIGKNIASLAEIFFMLCYLSRFIFCCLFNVVLIVYVIGKIIEVEFANQSIMSRLGNGVKMLVKSQFHPLRKKKKRPGLELA